MGACTAVMKVEIREKLLGDRQGLRGRKKQGEVSHNPPVVLFCCLTKTTKKQRLAITSAGGRLSGVRGVVTSSKYKVTFSPGVRQWWNILAIAPWVMCLSFWLVILTYR